MINKIAISFFKSIEDVELELGNLNVFIGANGAGKSNLLEAVGVLSAAAAGQVTDQTLMLRGVRPGVPKLYKSAFPTHGGTASAHIKFVGESDGISYAVALNNPLSDPSPAWKFKTEKLQQGVRKVASRSPKSKINLNTENGIAALKLADLSKDDPVLPFMRALQEYVIYTPTTPVLRGVAPETQPRQPLGLSGGRLAEAVRELLNNRSESEHARQVCREALQLITWAKSYGSSKAADLPLSPAASSSPHVIRFEDRYMMPSRNILSGYDASEGALYVLFLAVLAVHLKSPAFYAVDNADHGLNPGMARKLMESFANWLLADDRKRQVLLTCHNPAVLDGLPLQDDRVRLFAVDRDDEGKTFVKRVVIDDKMSEFAKKGWTLSRLWMNKLIGGMPDV